MESIKNSKDKGIIIKTEIRNSPEKYLFVTQVNWGETDPKWARKPGFGSRRSHSFTNEGFTSMNS